MSLLPKADKCANLVDVMTSVRLQVNLSDALKLSIMYGNHQQVTRILTGMFRSSPEQVFKYKGDEFKGARGYSDFMDFGNWQNTSGKWQNTNNACRSITDALCTKPIDRLAIDKRAFHRVAKIDKSDHYANLDYEAFPALGRMLTRACPATGGWFVFTDADRDYYMYCDRMVAFHKRWGTVGMMTNGGYASSMAAFNACMKHLARHISTFNPDEI